MQYHMHTAVRCARQLLKRCRIRVSARVRYQSDSLMMRCSGGDAIISIPAWQTVRTLPGLRRGLVRTLLHEFGHVFVAQNWDLLDAAGVNRVFGDLSHPYPQSILHLLNYRLGFASCGFISSYAAVHPEEDFVEVFAWVVWHGMNPPRTRDRVLQNKINFMIRILKW